MDLMEMIYYIGIPVAAVVLILLIVFFAWYCKRRRNQNAIDDALRSSQSYVNSTSNIKHTLHRDSSLTGQRNSDNSIAISMNKIKNTNSMEEHMNDNDINRDKYQRQYRDSNNSIKTGHSSNKDGNVSTPSDIVLKNSAPPSPIKLANVVPATESPLPSIDNDSDDENENDTNTNNKSNKKNKNKNKKSNKIYTSEENLISKEHGTSSTPVPSSKIVTLKKGSEMIDDNNNGNDNDSDPSIDDNDEINKIMNEEIDGDTMKRLTLHKKLSNINVKQRLGDYDDDDDDDEDEDSFNDDLIDTENIPRNRGQSGMSNGTAISNNNSNALLSPANGNGNGNGNGNSKDDKNSKHIHRRMVSQEEIDYFDKLKEETTDDTRDYRARTISHTNHNMHTKLIDPK